MVSKTPNKAREKNQAIGTAAKHCIGFPLIINYKKGCKRIMNPTSICADSSPFLYSNLAHFQVQL